MLDFLPIKIDIKKSVDNQRITNSKIKVKYTGYRKIRKDKN